MKQPDRLSSVDPAKQRAEADIVSFQAAVIGAPVEEVDEPTGRKRVEIVWEDKNGFHVKKGEAIGVYREYSDATGLSGEPRTAIECYHVDWTDGERTTVQQDELVDLEEGEWK